MTLETIINGARFEIVPLDQHPIDDPTLPSYQCDEYRATFPDIEFTSDMWHGKSSWISPDFQKINMMKVNRYLPSFTGEEEEDYRLRYKNTRWVDLFKKAIRKFPGLLSQLTYTNYLSQSIKNFWGNCDKQGTSFPAFFLDADLRVLLDQNCYILVDAPKQTKSSEKIFTPTDAERVVINRPFLKLIDRKDLINFIPDKNNKLSRAVIREFVSVPKDYGNDLYTQYRDFRDNGSFEVSILVRSIDDREDKKIYKYVVDTGRNNIGKMPIVNYSYDRIRPYTEKSPVYNLAELQLDYYRLLSQDFISLHQTNFPVWVRIGVAKNTGTKEPEQRKTKILSSSRMQDLPEGGDFKAVTAPSNWAEVNRNRLDLIQSEIDKQANEFIGLTSQAIKTATQVEQESTNSNAEILILAQRKIAALNQIEELWNDYLGLTTDRSEDSSNFRIDLGFLNVQNTPTKESSTTYSSEDSSGIIGS